MESRHQPNNVSRKEKDLENVRRQNTIKSRCLNSKSKPGIQDQAKSPKMTLKETILLRKMENERDHDLRWNIGRRKIIPRTNNKSDDDENLEEIRRKLMKNRERLLKLLNHGPDLIVQKSKSVENQAAAVESDMKNRGNLSVKDVESKNRRVYSTNYDSSSDEELVDPTPETYPNLSDEEFNDSESTTSIGYSSHNKLAYRHRNMSSNPVQDTDQVKPKIYGKVYSSDFASKRRIFDNPHKMSNYARKYPSKTPNNDLNQAEVVKLPYVSRGADNYRAQRKENGETTIDENKLLESFESKKTIHAPANSHDSIKTKKETGLALSSSGYSSSSSGNGSFSSSISNASFTMSPGPIPTSSEQVRYKTISPESNKSLSKDENRKPNDREKTSLNRSEAIIERSEFQSSGDLKFFPDRDSNSSFTEEKASSIKQARNVEDSLNRSKSFTEPMPNYQTGRNSVCMVEKPQVTKEKHKVRLRMLGSRSKKNEALRNSLAFAYYARGDSEVIAENKETEIDNRNQISRHSSFSRGPVLLPSYTSPPTQNDRFRKKDPASPPQKEHSAGSRRFNTISLSSGRRFSEQNLSVNGSSSQKQDKNPTLRSLNSSPQLVKSSPMERKPSFRNRLRGAFSFQNLKKAISTDKLEEDKSNRSVSHSYLNEFGEDISRFSSSRAQSTGDAGSLYKPSSIGSMFGSVRMRSKRVRERPSILNRNSIACDPKPIPEYDFQAPVKTKHDSSSDGVGIPGYFRPIGRVLKMDVREGTMQIEMIKPPSGPFGFYVARNENNGVVYVSSLNDSYPDKMFAGLMKAGDEILKINEKNVQDLTLDQIYDLILENDCLNILTKPCVSDPAR